MRQELGMAAGAIGALVAVAAGYVFYQANWGTPIAPLSPPAPLSQPVVQPASEPQRQQPAGDQVEPGQVAETPDATPKPDPESASTVAPAFDVVRIEPGGSALVAGTAEPGADVSLHIEGEVIATARADSSGNFVAMFTLPPAETPRVMTLTALSEGTEAAVPSEQSVIVAPPPPLVVAEVRTDDPAGPDPAMPVVGPTETGDVAVADATPPAAAPDHASGDVGVAASSGEDDPAKTADMQDEDVAVSDGDATSRSLGVLGGGGDETAPEADVAATELGAPPADGDAPHVAGEDPTLSDTPGDGTGEPAAQEEVAAADAPAPALTDGDGVTQLGAGEGDAAAQMATDTPQDRAVPGEPVAAAHPEESPAAGMTAEADISVTTPEPGGGPQVADGVDAAAETPVTPQSDAAPVVLLADSEGIKVLQDGGAGPQALQNVTIDTISYDVEGEVELAGRGRGAAAVRIYLDNAPIKTTRIAEDGRWRTPLPEVESGIYTLRVDELAEDGTVTSRSETPFLREEPAVVAAAAAAEGDAAVDADKGTGATAPALRVITVQPGYTLWGIAQSEYGAGELYVRVYNANRDQIRDPHWIYPGQVFTLPGE